jgi:hypothetical protein
MHITSSLDWDQVRSKLRQNGYKVGADPKFSKMLTHLDNLVRTLSNMEVDIRRTRKIPSSYQELVTKINDEIYEIEMILMMSALHK